MDLGNDELLLEKTMKKQHFLENKGLFSPEKYFQGISTFYDQENKLDNMFSSEELEKRGESPPKLQEKHIDNVHFLIENVKKTGFKSFSQHVMKENLEKKHFGSPQILGKKLMQTKKNEGYFNYKQGVAHLRNENLKKTQGSARNKTKSIFIQTKENVPHAILKKPAVKTKENNYSRGISVNFLKKRLI